MKSPFVARVALVGMITTAGAVAQSDAPAQPAQQEDVESGASAHERAREAFGRPRLRPVGQDDGVAGLFRRARLGVTVESTPEGLSIGEVTEGSLAQSAGIQTGDILVSLDGQRVRDVEHLRNILARIAHDAEFEIGVVRAGEGLVKLTGRMQRPEPEGLFDGHRGGFLGVTLGEPAEGGGVLLEGVFEGTAAWFIGLEQGDVLHSIDDQATTSPKDVAAAVATREPGAMVTLAYSRAGDEHTVQVRLGRRAMNRLLGFTGLRDLPRFNGRLAFTPRPGAFAWSSDYEDLFEGNLDLFLHELPAFKGNVRDRIHELMAEYDGDRNVSIDLRDGVLTIESDGDVQVFDLNDSGPDAGAEPSDI